MSKELDMSAAARWARVEAERVKRGESQERVAVDNGFSRTAYTMGFRTKSVGKLLVSIERKYGLAVGSTDPDPRPEPKPSIAVFGFDHTLARILDRHHIGEPGDHIMLRLGILSERLKNIGGEK